MSAMPPVVIYGYKSSPFTQKIEYLLLLKRIPYFEVEVSFVLPRPEITDLLGVSYRRIPILAIGNDVYCDTSLIASTLERRFPPSEGYGTIFSVRKGSHKADTGLVKAFSMYYSDRVIFPLAAGFLPWHKMPSYFIKDRSALRGTAIDPKSFLVQQPQSKVFLSSHLSLLEDQLKDDRDWLFDTELPGLGDVSVFFVYAWIQQNPAAKDIFDSSAFPKALKWLSRMTNFFKEKRRQELGISTKISGEEAAKLIASSTFEPYSVVGFNHLESNRLGINPGGRVAVGPTDTGVNQRTAGKLVGFNREETVIETHGQSGVIRCHFPRLNFTVSSISIPQKL